MALAEPPETHYAHNGDVAIAYQVVGDGPIDLVFIPGFISHVEHWWDIPQCAHFMRRLASFSRLILFDKRGTGLSDPVDEVASIEERMDDTRAVMDAAGSERAALLALSEGGTLGILFAATYPERVESLVLLASTARVAWAEDWPFGWRDADQMRLAFGQWGTGDGFARMWAPSLAHLPEFNRAMNRFQRLAASPRMARNLFDLAIEIDARDACPAVQAPTLCLHADEDRTFPAELAPATAALIPGAQVRLVASRDHLPWAEGADEFLDEIEEFVTGERGERDPDRILATVLFSDIVDSTRRASEMGDRAWRELLASFDGVARREVARHRGRMIKGLGDGHLAAFDVPARAVRCAQAMTRAAGELGLGLRAGVHTGECEVQGDDLAGLGVHIGARVGAAAAPGEVLASSTVRDLSAGSGIAWEDRGAHVLKGVPGEWRLYAVTPGR